MRLHVITIPLVALLAGAGCASTPDDAVAPQPVLRAPSRPEIDRGSIGSPTTGVPYPVTLFTHCGIRLMKFGSREWIAISPVEQPYPNQLVDYISGTATLVRQIWRDSSGATAFRTSSRPRRIRFRAACDRLAVLRRLSKRFHIEVVSTGNGYAGRIGGAAPSPCRQ